MGQRELADWLLAQVEERNLSQAEASRRAGLAHNAISEIVNGTPAGVKRIAALARFFGVSTEYVLRLAGHLPPAARNGDLSPEALADLDQIRRYLAMLSPDAQRRTAEQLVNLARLAIDLSEPDHSENAA